MSDINIIPDGVVAFIVAAVVALVLLLAIIAGSLYALSRALQKKERFIQQAIFPHLLGVSLSLAGALVIMLLIVLTDSMPRPHALNIWLDNWVWLWAVIILLLWPVGVYAGKARYHKSLK
ncbi:MAG TPA: hypothetical protein VJS44_18685 [Pyrinomonadaceae bacterium]|nr:hypothetical protein [Pyrinomonadaceae bacterium]